MSVYKKDQFFRDPHFPFHIGRYTITRNQHIASHTHDFVELVFVASGRAQHEMSGNPYTLQAGDVFVVEPDIYHSYTGSSDEEAVVYNILFEPALLTKELKILLHMPSFVHFFYLMPFLRRNTSFIPYQHLMLEEKTAIETHLEMILDEYLSCREGYQLLIKTRWIECLIWLGRYLKQEYQMEPATYTDEEWLESVRHFITKHYNQPLTLKQMSQISKMSISAFTFKFKAATGNSFLDYKHDVQITSSCMLLKETTRKIVDIAQEVGFYDISFFNKVFRKHIGKTPKEYRNMQRNG